MVSNVNSSNDNIVQLLMNTLRSNSQHSVSNSANSNQSNAISGSTTDANGFLNCLQNNFAKIDTNGDKTLSQDEISSFAKNSTPMGPPPGLSIENMEKFSESNASQKSQSAQNTSNGASFNDSLTKAFSSLDSDKDGKVSEEELKNAKINNQNTTASTGVNTGSNATDAFSTIWNKINSSDTTHKLIGQLAQKLSNAYSTQGSGGNLLSSALNFKI